MLNCSRVCLIDIPPKIWRPKVQSKYRLPEYTDDISEGIFDFTHYGKCVFKPKTWDSGTRDDIIYFNEKEDTKELQDNIKIGKNVSQDIKDELIQSIKDYWDCFAKKGVHRYILGYEFGVDTGTHTPVCCKKPAYGPHESKIIMEQIQDLLKNKWIVPCRGPWGSLIVLAAKPHQESVTKIDDFIWRMCVSYRKLNEITRPFQYPIPRCDDSIASLDQGSNTIYQISMDADSGYHQIKVKDSDHEKLAFFAPDHQKYTFTVMPFGPTNAPSFYSAMMYDFKTEWDHLFVITIAEMKIIDGEPVTVNGTIIFIGKKKLCYGSRTIIDDIFIWTSNLRLTLVFFRCVCEVFKKYRVSFKLKKCEFLKDRTEYVGYDILSNGNAPAQSKFNMINDWKLPTTGQSLHSFIGLINFYHRFAPYLEIRLKPLRRLCKKYFRKDIPQMEWTRELITLFEELKICITSSPILARYDPEKPTFLKTDWSAEGMGWILMQPADDEESSKAAKILLEDGTCHFDLCKNGARLRPIAFGSRSCTDMEKKLHSFLGEVACGRWAISQNKRFLWGCLFYWLCDCSAVREILDYQGSISYVCRWAQELLGYQFACIHRSNKMMIDVDSLTRRYGKGTADYIAISSLLKEADRKTRPQAYDASDFTDASCKKLPLIQPTERVITDATIQNVKPSVSSSGTEKPVPTLYSAPIKFHSFNPTKPYISTDKESHALHHVQQLQYKILVIDDSLSSSDDWHDHNESSSLSWRVDKFFFSPTHHQLHKFLHPKFTGSTSCMSSDVNLQELFADYAIIDWSCTTWPHTGLDWIQFTLKTLRSLLTTSSNLTTCILWISSEHFQGLSSTTADTILQKHICDGWYFSSSFHHGTTWGSCLDLQKFVITLSRSPDIWTCTPEFQTDQPHNLRDCLGEIADINHLIIHDIIVPREALIDLHSSDPWSSRSIGILNHDIKDLSTAHMILDPLYPGREPAPYSNSNELLGRRFGLLHEHDLKTFVLRVSDLMLLRLYTITPFISVPFQAPIDSLDDILRTSTPSQMKLAIAHTLIAGSNLTEDIYFGSEETAEATRCYFTQKLPEILDWSKAYSLDTTTATILAKLEKPGPHKWTKEMLKPIDSKYHQPLSEDRIQVANKKLILLKPIMHPQKYVGLLIVPESLRRNLFAHYHCGPTGAHMGEYKTLFRIRLRFFWPTLRDDIKKWIKGCPHCIAKNIWRNRRHELYFSWPVTAPFYIIHCDIWVPGKLLTAQGNTVSLLNAMCDLTQFVVSSIVENPTAAELARVFMDQVLLSFGMCAVVVVDADSKFKSAFEDMCKKLGLLFWPLARNNHKGLSVERYHRFLNETQTIVGQERGTHMTILQNAKLSQYAWNSAPIDNTDVTRSMAALGREFRFPLDVELSPTPTLNDAQNTQLFEYLRNASNNGPFATSVVKLIVEDRRATHRARMNKGKPSQIFKVGDAVTARVSIQSKADTGTVQKLSYKARGPFQIVEVLGSDSYTVRRYGLPNSEPRKYKGTDLFLLPPAIFPNDPLDTIDCRYLNFDHVPLVDPMQPFLKVDMYNDTFFSMTGKQHSTNNRTDTPNLSPSTTWSDNFPSAASLHNETKTSGPTIETDNTDVSYFDCISIRIESSIDKVLLIQFLPAGMMRPKWYPIQIDITATSEVNPNYKSNNKFWCVFLARHPDDRGKSDQYSRWWPDWYKYSHDSTTRQIIYGQRVLFKPSQIPDSRKFIQWAELITLDTTNILVEPFNFATLDNENRARNTIPRDCWMQLTEACKKRGLIPPTLGAQISHRINTRNLKQPHRRKRKRA